jgi:3-dehydro-L-gulonate 2-dehydrogenase
MPTDVYVPALTLAGVGLSAAAAAHSSGALPRRVSRLLAHLSSSAAPPPHTPSSLLSAAPASQEATGRTYGRWVTGDGTVRIAPSELRAEYSRVLQAAGVAEDRAALVAGILTENQIDGVYSHGLNRFGALLKQLSPAAGAAQTKPNATPEAVGSLGALEQWDGKMGLGPVNAHVAMARAVELSAEHGIGCVAMRNTNHWQRGGAYGLQAADAGCIGICWTNTSANMPPWGSSQVTIGNNPFVLAVPRPSGEHVLLDMATSQFANGKLEIMSQQGESLSLPGGYNDAGELTCDPAEVLATKRALPIGYWKGSGLTILLDMVAAVLAGGRATHDIRKDGARSEFAVSQVFIAIRVPANDGASSDGVVGGVGAAAAAQIEAIIEDVHASTPISVGGRVSYPGEGMLETRRKNLR